MLEHRIADPRILRLIRLRLRAGVMEDGVYTDSERGTPHGSGISPLLANIYLHLRPGCVGAAMVKASGARLCPLGPLCR
jgi:hypothetical protein